MSTNCTWENTQGNYLLALSIAVYLAEKSKRKINERIKVRYV